jgi:hypothetical protein
MLRPPNPHKTGRSMLRPYIPPAVNPEVQAAGCYLLGRNGSPSEPCM